MLPSGTLLFFVSAVSRHLQRYIKGLKLRAGGQNNFWVGFMRIKNLQISQNFVDNLGVLRQVGSITLHRNLLPPVATCNNA